MSNPLPHAVSAYKYGEELGSLIQTRISQRAADGWGTCIHIARSYSKISIYGHGAQSKQRCHQCNVGKSRQNGSVYHWDPMMTSKRFHKTLNEHIEGHRTQNTVAICIWLTATRTQKVIYARLNQKNINHTMPISLIPERSLLMLSPARDDCNLSSLEEKGFKHNSTRDCDANSEIIVHFS